MIGGSVSVYMLGYSLFFLFQKTEIQGLVDRTVYTLTMLLGCGLIGLCTGTLGFVSSYAIIRRIYSTSKKD